MDEKELSELAIRAFPESKKRIRKYFSLLDHVNYYGRLMERPDSPWVCTAYNNALANLDYFCRKNPDIAEWVEQNGGEKRG